MAASEGGFLTPESKPLPIEPGLLERFLDAEKGVAWRPVPPAPRPPRSRTRRKGTGARARAEADSRIAYYHDETARIERRSVGTEEILTVTSGPVGALVLVGECARRGLPTSLEARNAGDLPEFPEGALEARWDAHRGTGKHAIPFGDVVQLARYALA
ncbi:MAG TPA: hypothetical protein VKT21_06225 [Thermoplasmata archaeon]|nr:hypothetical protein [Thermoplasmata archaeon]